MKQIEYNFWKYSSPQSPLDVIMVGESFCDKTYSIERKHSDLHSLEFIVDGEGILDINNQHLCPVKNDVFLLTEKSCHHYYTNGDKPWHKIYVVIRGPVADSLIKNYLPKSTYLFKDCDLKKNFENIFNCASNKRLDYNQIVELITIEIIKILSYLRFRSSATNECAAEKIKKLIDYHIDSSFSMNMLCNELNYTENHIINIFKKEYGITPYSYYNTRRIDAAKYYLSNTQISTDQLSALLGYCDSKYFINCFKNETGCTPKEYKKRL